jgi:hypothetical protein
MHSVFLLLQVHEAKAQDWMLSLAVNYDGIDLMNEAHEEYEHKVDSISEP